MIMLFERRKLWSKNYQMIKLRKQLKVSYEGKADTSFWLCKGWGATGALAPAAGNPEDRGCESRKRIIAVFAIIFEHVYY